jgi:hypothetical protein
MAANIGPRTIFASPIKNAYTAKII